MCIHYTNVRWACQGWSKKPCKRPSPNLEPKLYHCLRYHTHRRPLRTSPPCETTFDDTQPFYKSLACPYHHAKRLKTLDAHWAAEWEWLDQETPKWSAVHNDWHQFVVLNEQQQTQKRAEIIQGGLKYANEHETEFYKGLLVWQLITMKNMRRERKVWQKSLGDEIVGEKKKSPAPGTRGGNP
ncbi:hypothetical protein B0T17DRAFT_612905 [Bombardia bombarda]|uniref:Uncharacterized protein n=1 Tax=Bombardia bombarda TaxID=252184 RepID=A0AA39XLI4_9PEZI|nr:hypothetical protein B0T17DRAFT_612905 [Bombardia bombarda]